MIEQLEGRLVHKAPTLVHLQLGPIRLELSVPLSTSRTLPEESQAVQLWTHLVWRESGPELFGFASRPERELFRLLILVQGIGPRIALSLLSHLSPLECVRQIRQKSAEGLTRVPGIGPKTAARILVELAPRIDQLATALAGEGEGAGELAGAEDAMQALAALGYPPRESRKAVQRILHDAPGLSLDECIRRSLQELAGLKG